MLRLYWTMLFKTRHRAAIADMPKLVEVVMSVSKAEQAEAALNYINIYTQRHLHGSDGYVTTTKGVLNQLVKYVNDTRDHCLYGGDKYPDMNDYVGTVLNIRFKPFWQRGVSSIAGPK